MFASQDLPNKFGMCKLKKSSTVFNTFGKFTNEVELPIIILPITYWDKRKPR